MTPEQIEGAKKNSTCSACHQHGDWKGDAEWPGLSSNYAALAGHEGGAEEARAAAAGMCDHHRCAAGAPERRCVGTVVTLSAALAVAARRGAEGEGRRVLPAARASVRLAAHDAAAQRDHGCRSGCS